MHTGTLVHRTIRVATLALLLAVNVAAQERLTPQGYVSDHAGILDPAFTQELTTQLRALEAETTAEIAVATVGSLDGRSIEEYAADLFRAWGVGQKGLNNGVLVLVARDDRRVRIEVGYGLEPILPDGLAGEIIRQQFLPPFRDSDYAGGIRAGVDRIAAIIRARHVVTPEEREALASGDHSADWIMVPFFGIFVAVGAAAIGLGVRAKAFGAIAFGLVMGGIPLLLSLLMIPGWTKIVIVPLGLVMMAVGVRLGGSSKWRQNVRSNSGSGWVVGGSGGSSGGSDSSSSSSSGSFGGGSSGGGGASGSW